MKHFNYQNVLNGKNYRKIDLIIQVKMTSHLAGGPVGKSRFDFDVDADKAVLDAAVYANEYGLWYASSGNPNDFADKDRLYSWLLWKSIGG